MRGFLLRVGILERKRFLRTAAKKLLEWLRRYAPAEIAGTLAAFAAGLGAHALTGSLAVAAACGTAGENVGYYGVILRREIRAHWHQLSGYKTLKRASLTALCCLRGLLVEFGPGEVLDSLLIRPGLMYAVPAFLIDNVALGLLIAKILADLAFYCLVIPGYELQKRLFTKKAKE